MAADVKLTPAQVRVLACGSRNWTDVALIRSYLNTLPQPFVLIHGAARGADSIAASEAKKMAQTIEAYPANWNKHGKAAGPIRNRQMLEEGKPHMVLAFRNDGPSPGTDNMVEMAKAAGLPVIVVESRAALARA